MIKQLSQLLKTTDVIGVFLVINCCRYLTPDLPTAVLIGLSSGAILLLVSVRWLTTEGVENPTHPVLPVSAIKRLRQSLHHSQVPVFETLMEPMLAAYYPQLVACIVGKKSNEEPLTAFDEKVALWQDAFQALTTSKRLYQERLFEGRDRALTLLVFLAILWGNQVVESQLGERLKTLPANLYSLLREQAYRLYDLPFLLTRNQLVINQEFSSLFATISALNRNETSSLISRSEADLTARLEVVAAEPCPLETLLKNPITEEDKPIAVFTAQGDDENKGVDDLLIPFKHWLTQRIASGNEQFSLDSQALVLCNSAQFGSSTVFLLPDVLGKYQSRSGVGAELLESVLKEAFSGNKLFRIEREGQVMDVLPCVLNESFTTDASTPLLEGECV